MPFEAEVERSEAEEVEGSLPQTLILQSEVEAVEPHIPIPHSEDVVISHQAKAEAEAEDDDDAIIALVEDEDLPSTSTTNAGDEEDDEEDDSLSLPDVGQDLGGDDDDEDDDDDNFTIQYHTRPAPAQKGVSLREFSSKGEKEKSQGNQHTTS
ncbi:nonsense-mediated mRNA decay protein 2-like [Cynara cardunculus var. scolymus]|uniref:nonsense-mediated mRNA decay protein 2-like n=1 Tax=Cynara cardunculus var. scolymus TaxID=59895 RepID=UPI000D62F869|nr:nonsense-mediated mRNA decay protein 2-like [Cynara cardunculus var. scolymus]